jgi:hypothetical protein
MTRRGSSDETKAKYDNFIVDVKDAIAKDRDFYASEMALIHGVSTGAISILKELGFITQKGNKRVFNNKGYADHEISDLVLDRISIKANDYVLRKKEEQRQKDLLKGKNYVPIGESKHFKPAPAVSIPAKQLVEIEEKIKPSEILEAKVLNSLTEKISDIFQIGLKYGIPMEQLGKFSNEICKLQN